LREGLTHPQTLHPVGRGEHTTATLIFNGSLPLYYANFPVSTPLIIAGPRPCLLAK